MNVSSTTATDAARLGGTDLSQRQTALRTAVNEVVGTTFFGELLKTARNSTLKGEYGHGGRGEEIFRGQLDLELARRAGSAMDNGLSETLYRRYSERL